MATAAHPMGFPSASTPPKHLMFFAAVLPQAPAQYVLPDTVPLLPG